MASVHTDVGDVDGDGHLDLMVGTDEEVGYVLSTGALCCGWIDGMIPGDAHLFYGPIAAPRTVDGADLRMQGKWIPVGQQVAIRTDINGDGSPDLLSTAHDLQSGLYGLTSW